MGAALISFCLCRFIPYLVRNKQADFENNPHPVQEQGFNMNMSFWPAANAQATWTGLPDVDVVDVPLGAYDPPYNLTGASYSGTAWMKPFMRITQWTGASGDAAGSGLQVTYAPGMFASQSIIVSGAQPMFLRFGFRGYTKENVKHVPYLVSQQAINNILFQNTYQGAFAVVGVQGLPAGSELVRGTVGGVSKDNGVSQNGLLTSFSADITITSDEGFTLSFLVSGSDFLTIPPGDPANSLCYRVFHCTRLFED